VLELRDVPPDPDRTAAAVSRMAARRVATRFVDPDDARSQAEEVVDRTADLSSWVDVVDGDDVVGTLWLGTETEELVVYDVVLDAPARATELLPALVERARAAGARMLGIGVDPDDPVRQAIGSLPGLRVRATNMVLPLDRPVADPAPLTLRAMTAAEFDTWRDGTVEGYAAELAATGLSRERADERSRSQMAELIPSGLESPGMEFFLARVGDDVVGDLWLHTADPMAFVYNIEVRPDQRRRGYGAAIMNAAAVHCRDAGHPYLGLNVFAHNPNARALYDKLGYRVTLDYRALDIPDAG
jgi:ribosomal protein S18 acetylase RimI-like enzyme